MTSKNYLKQLKVVFLLGKDLNNEKTVDKIRFANSRDWYLFNPDLDHNSVTKHQILQNRIDEIDYEKNVEMEWFLTEKSRSIYLNTKNEFVFARRKLINERDQLLAEMQNNQPIINPSTSYSANTPSNLNYSANTIIDNQNLNMDEIELNKFDRKLDNPFEFINKFEAKYKNSKTSPFVNFKKHLSQEDHNILFKNSFKMTWNLFVEFFLKTYGEEYRLRVRNLDRSQFVIGGKVDLNTFIQKKFELYEKHFIGVPESVQIKQIINSLPDEYAKKLFFNLDSNKEDFLERVAYVEISDSEDENDESHSKTNDVTNTTLDQSNTTTSQLNVTISSDQTNLTENLKQSNSTINLQNTTNLKQLDAATSSNQSNTTTNQLNATVNSNQTNLINSYNNQTSNDLLNLVQKIDSQANKFNEMSNILENFFKQLNSNSNNILIRNLNNNLENATIFESKLNLNNDQNNISINNIDDNEKISNSINNQFESSTSVNVVNNNLVGKNLDGIKQVESINLDNSNDCVIQTNSNDNQIHTGSNDIDDCIIQTNSTNSNGNQIQTESNDIDDCVIQVNSTNPNGNQIQTESNDLDDCVIQTNSNGDQMQTESDNLDDCVIQTISANPNCIQMKTEPNNLDDCPIKANSTQIVLDDNMIQNDTHEIFVIDDEEDEQFTSSQFSSQSIAKKIVKKYRNFNKRKKLFDIRLENSKKIKLI